MEQSPQRSPLRIRELQADTKPTAMESIVRIQGTRCPPVGIRIRRATTDMAA